MVIEGSGEGIGATGSAAWLQPGRNENTKAAKHNGLKIERPFQIIATIDNKMKIIPRANSAIFLRPGFPFGGGALSTEDMTGIVPEKSRFVE